MKEKKDLLKELRKKQFNTFLENEEFLSLIIGQAINIDKEYLLKKIKKEQQEEYEPYDLIIKITDTKIKIRTSKYNKRIKDINKKGEFYKKWYDENSQEYKIKISIDKMFEKIYNMIEQEQQDKLKELFSEEPLNEEDIINMLIIELGLKYADNIKITISGTL